MEQAITLLNDPPKELVLFQQLASHRPPLRSIAGKHKGHTRRLTCWHTAGDNARLRLLNKECFQFRFEILMGSDRQRQPVRMMLSVQARSGADILERWSRI